MLALDILQQCLLEQEVQGGVQVNKLTRSPASSGFADIRADDLHKTSCAEEQRNRVGEGDVQSEVSEG